MRMMARWSKTSSLCSSVARRGLNYHISELAGKEDYVQKLLILFHLASLRIPFIADL